MRHVLFTCRRAKEVWKSPRKKTEVSKSLGLLNVIKEAVLVDHSGSVVLEKVLRWQITLSQNSSKLGLKETILCVEAWYIWWQRREAVKGNHVAPPAVIAFAIQALATNFAQGSGTGNPHKIT